MTGPRTPTPGNSESREPVARLPIRDRAEIGHDQAHDFVR